MQFFASLHSLSCISISLTTASEVHIICKASYLDILYIHTGYSGSDRPAYMSDLAQQAVFMSQDPSICILFNSVNNSHTIWKIRRAKTEVNVKPLTSFTIDLYNIKSGF